MSRLTTLVALLVSTALFAHEYEINRYNETLLSFNKNVLGVNCTPFSKGKIVSVKSSNNSASNFFLKVVPNGKKGDLHCFFKLGDSALVKVKFKLGDNTNIPLVDIVNKEAESNSDSLKTFLSFTREDLIKHPKFTQNQEFEGKGITVRTDDNIYRFIRKYISNKGNHFYIIESDKTITDQYFKLKNVMANTIMYSSVVNSDAKGSLIYISSKKTLKLEDLL